MIPAGSTSQTCRFVSGTKLYELTVAVKKTTPPVVATVDGSATFSTVRTGSRKRWSVGKTV